MSYTDDVMTALSTNIRNFNNNLYTFKNLEAAMTNYNEEMRRANNLKELELGLQTGAYTKEEAKELIESWKPAPAKQKTKSFWNK